MSRASDTVPLARIAELKGDTLKIGCAGADGEKKRPTGFMTLKGSKRPFLELKREK